jgi:hypothetical protein
MLQALAGNKVGGPADRLGFAGKKDPGSFIAWR